MTRAQDLTKALEPLLREVEVGTKDYPRKVARIDIAIQRAEDRAGGGNVPNGEPDLTSDGPVVVDSEMSEEHRNQERVKRQAEKDAWALQTKIARMIADARDIAVIMTRQVEIVSESKLPTDVLPGCRSCARKEEADGHTVGGHWAPVDTKGTAPAEGLCRQCYEFKCATGGIPPVGWCHRRHTKGAKDANRWLAKEYPALKVSVDRKAKAKGLTAEDLLLRPENLIVSQPEATVC